MRYFLVKFTRTKIIAFDIDEALRFEGESGPYLQYAVVRASNIFAQAGAIATGRRGRPGRAPRRRLPTDALEPGDDADALWDLVLEAARLDEIVEQAVRTLEPSVLAKYAFGLAQAFNALLPPLPDPHRGAPGAPPVARRRDQRLPPPAHRGAVADGHRRARSHVSAM